MPATAELAPALAVLATELRACGEPWWLIGSAAMAAHGAPVPVRDIDVLLGLTDAAALLTARGLAAAGVPDGRFRSELFASWDAAPFTVELFAGFHVRDGDGWRRLVPETREARNIGNVEVFVPAIAELIAWGRLFDRPKDREREPLLRALLPA